MIKRNDPLFQRPAPKVFVNAIFEIAEGHTPLPTNKSELVDLVKKKIVVPFHEKICKQCHSIPGQRHWMQDLNETGKIFIVFEALCYVA